MLKTPPHPPVLDAHLLSYLHETLGLAAQISRWAGDKKVPYYLRHPFEFLEDPDFLPAPAEGGFTAENTPLPHRDLTQDG